MSTLASQFNPLVDADQRLLKHASLTRKVLYAGLATAGAGSLLAAALPAGVGSALVVGGIVATMGCILSGRSIERRHQDVIHQYWPLRNRHDQLEAERHVIDAAVSAARAVQAQAEEAVKADGGSLEVLKMSEALAEKPITPPPVVTVTDEAVTIGGVRVRRSHTRPEQGPSPSGS
ncbi:MAG: hypothetical protein EB084_20955 [Proteobacteria bacterium]|nr:hypothetical protein [Pseudomonadota bacterium]